MTPPKPQRLFFALWPDADAAARLERVASLAHAVCGGRPMRRENLHLTLAFLGNVPTEKVATLCRMAQGLRGACFDLLVDRLGEWRRQGLVWAGCSAPSPQLAALVALLQQGLRDMGMKVEARAVTPHITLVRNAQEAGFDALPRLDPVVWPADDFVLVASRLAPGGADYRIIDRWPLQRIRHPAPN